MEPNGVRFSEQHPWIYSVFIVLKRFRTKVGFLLAAYCLVEGLVKDEVPFDLGRPNTCVVLGLALIFIGFTLRFVAYGSLKKKESLATSGVYSLCRHPLYLGSILLTYGFCFLLDDIENYVIATIYFMVFYTIAIAWEERRLAERFGDVHQGYCQGTPLMLPLGRYRRGVFAWDHALRAGGHRLIVATIALLLTVEVMAECMPSR